MLQALDNVTSVGETVLNNFDVYHNKNWFWIGSGALLGFIVLLNSLYTVSLMYLSGKSQYSFLCLHGTSSFVCTFKVTVFHGFVLIN